MMKNLNGVWRLKAFEAESEKRALTDLDSVPALPADVPGNVEFALQAAGMLPDDLFMGDNILKCQEFETWDYVYERHFNLTAEELEKSWRLVFEGVDCVADYYLNGTLLGCTDNALIPHTFLCGNLLQQENCLQIYLRSPLAAAALEDYSPFSIKEAYYHNYEQLRLRKPASCFGWDIMPRTVSAGLWRGVRLEEVPESELEDVYIATARADEREASLMVNFRVRTLPKYIRRLSLRVEGVCGDSNFCEERKIYFIAGFVNIKLKNPKLWMPRGYGEANLYNMKVTLLVDGVEAHVWKCRTGIRTIRLDRKPQEFGFREFCFYVNGQKIFCKGSNWVPMDAFHSRDSLRYEQAVGMLADLNCNIVRCWGGNVYEDHAFFDLCDQYGILVWQDFSMACGPYPEDEKFARAMDTEARAIIKRLRGHASLALWCGDNECDYYSEEPKTNTITRKLLPDIVRREDPYRPYLASSPDLGERADGDFSYSGVSAEQHIWGARDHYKADFYTQHNARFVSETGYHGCNSPTSIAKFITPDAQWPWKDNHEWKIHAADAGRDWYSDRINMMAKQTRQMIGFVPDNLDDFAFVSQFTQAEAKKFFIEKMRMGKWERTGVIWWNLTDGWPQFSDAIVDYYFEKKLAYGHIKHSQQDVVLCMGEINSWKSPLMVVNDTLQDAVGAYSVTDADSGEVLAEGAFTAPANTSKTLEMLDVFYSEHKMLLLKLEMDGKTVWNHHLFGEVPFAIADLRRWQGILDKLPDCNGCL